MEGNSRKVMEQAVEERLKETSFDQTIKEIDHYLNRKHEAYTYEQHRNWRTSITAEERVLATMIFSYEEEYFGDMMMEEYSSELTAAEVLRTCTVEEYASESTAALISSEISSGLQMDGEWVPIQDGFSDQYPGLANWVFCIEDDTTEYEGNCYTNMQKISICRRNRDDACTILHEMIHAYESMLSETHRQYVTIRLYDKLSKKFPHLLDWLNADSHEYAKVHSVLFFLKSIDLDDRLGKEPGSVYGYDRQEWFPGFTGKSEDVN